MYVRNSPHGLNNTITTTHNSEYDRGVLGGYERHDGGHVRLWVGLWEGITCSFGAKHCSFSPTPVTICAHFDISTWWRHCGGEKVVFRANEAAVWGHVTRHKSCDQAIVTWPQPGRMCGNDQTECGCVKSGGSRGQLMSRFVGSAERAVFSLFICYLAENATISRFTALCLCHVTSRSVAAITHDIINGLVYYTVR